MTILFVAGELTDWDAVGSINNPTSMTTTAGRFRTLARAATAFYINSSSENTAFYKKDLSAFTDIWATCRYYGSSVGSAYAFLIGFGSSNTRRLALAHSGTTGKLCLVKVNTANTVTLLATESGLYDTNTLYKYDVQVSNYDDTVNGTINVWRSNSDGNDAELILTYTGDLTTNGLTSLNQVMMQGTILSNSSINYSEFIVSTDITRGMGLVTHEPTANGNAFQWTNDYTAIDEITVNDGDTSVANADGDLLQVAFNSSRLGNPNAIRAFIVAHRSRAGATIPKVTPNLRLGGTNYFGTQITPPAGYLNYQEIFETNPATSVPFVASDITTAGVNYGLRANT